MKPTIGDLVNGTKQILQEVVFPFVAAHPDDPEQPAVLENLLSVMVLLEHAAQRWDRFHIFLETERKQLNRLAVKTGVPTLKLDRTKPLTAIWEENRSLKESISNRLQTGLNRTLKKSFQSLIENEKEWVQVGEIVWD